MSVWATALSTLSVALGGLFKIIIGYWLYWREKEATKKKLKKEALAEMKEGLRRHDPQMITDAFDKARRAKRR